MEMTPQQKQEILNWLQSGQKAERKPGVDYSVEAVDMNKITSGKDVPSSKVRIDPRTYESGQKSIPVDKTTSTVPSWVERRDFYYKEIDKLGEDGRVLLRAVEDMNPEIRVPFLEEMKAKKDWAVSRGFFDNDGIALPTMQQMDVLERLNHRYEADIFSKKLREVKDDEEMPSAQIFAPQKISK